MSVAVAIAVFLGALTWSLMEYVFHRFLGHDKRTQPNFFSVEHLRHHSVGNYFAPAWKKAVLAVIVFALFSAITVPLFGAAVGMSYVGSFVVTYLAYEWLHKREHTHEGIGPYARWARRHHFVHHFVNPKMNHGVTSPVWDIVFGTYLAPEVIPVPEKLQMEWLCEEGAHEVKEHLKRDYCLKLTSATQAKLQQQAA